MLHAYIELPSPGSADETRFVYLSPQTREIVGYAAEELIADPSHLGRMLHPDDRDRVISLNACERTGQPFDSEYRVIAKDGTVVWPARGVARSEGESRAEFIARVLA